MASTGLYNKKAEGPRVQLTPETYMGFFSMSSALLSEEISESEQGSGVPENETYATSRYKSVIAQSSCQLFQNDHLHFKSFTV